MLDLERLGTAPHRRHQHAAIPPGLHIDHVAVHLDARELERRPVGGQPGREREAGRRGPQAHEPGEHRLRHEHALHELTVDPQSAGGAAPLERAPPRHGVVGPLATGLLHLGKPGEDLLEPLPGVVRPGHVEPREQVEIAEAEHRPAVLDLAPPGDRGGISPGPDVGLDVAAGGRSRAEPPVVDVGSLRAVAGDRPAAIDPIEDRAGLLGARQPAGDRLQVEKRETVVLAPAIFIDPADKPAGLGVPEPGLEI